MKLGQALMLAASAAAAAGAAVYAKKKFDSKGAKKEEDKASRWKSLPQDAEVVIPKKKPVHSAAVKEEVTETTPCENEIVSQLARDIEIVSAEEEPEVQPTANEEASVQQETSEVAVAEQTEEKPALQKKQKQKKYYAPVDFTFTEEENEAPVSFENVMEHFKEVELTEEEKQYYVPATEDAREEADAESYAEIEEDEKTIFESFLDEPVVEKEEEIPDTEEEEVIQDANEQQAFQDFAHAVAPVPLVVNEVTAIPESEAERITSESAQIPSIDGIPSLSAEEETPAVIEEIIQMPEATEEAVEEVAEAPIIEEVVAPVIEEVAEAPVIEEVADTPVIEDVAEAPIIEEVAEAPVTEEVIKIAEPAPFVEADMGISLPDMDEESDGSHAAIDPMKEAMINADFGDLLTDIAVAPDAPKKTLDFFDNPEEEELRHTVSDDEVSMEDLFGDLLAETDAKPEPAITSPSEVFNMFDTGSVDEDDFDDYKDEKIEKAQEMISTSDTRRAIAQDIADNIDLFAQLLEPLNAIKENKVRVKSGILFDWEMRIQSLIGDPPIKSYWRNNFANYEIWTDEKYMEKADELLSMLQLVGIVRDNVKEVVINRETLEFYSAQSEQMNNDFNIGETAVVVRPCWKINGRPARKGEITKKAPFADFSSKNVSPLEQMLRANKCDDGDVNIPVSEDNFCSFDKDVPYIKQAISSGVCKCAVRRMEGGTALAFFYEVISDGDSQHYDACTLRFEATIDKNCKIVGRFRGEKV